MSALVLAGLLLLPRVIFSNAYCQVTEYTDHYVAVCNGVKTEGGYSVGSSEVAQLTQGSRIVSSNQKKAGTTAGNLTGNNTNTSGNVSMVDQNHVVKTPLVHREGRPNKADMDAAIAARKQLILSRRGSGSGNGGEIQAYPIMNNMVK